MEDKYRILLTEKLLGESFFEDSGKFYTGLYTNGDLIPMRTFDTWEDFGAVWEAMQKREDCKEFLLAVLKQNINAVDKYLFPQLCAEWLEQFYEWNGKGWRDTI